MDQDERCSYTVQLVLNEKNPLVCVHKIAPVILHVIRLMSLVCKSTALVGLMGIS